MISTLIAAFAGSFLGAFLARWIERAQNPPTPEQAKREFMP
jgi:uncharacterized membrane protein YjjB (DUF3815 family)